MPARDVERAAQRRWWLAPRSACIDSTGGLRDLDDESRVIDQLRIVVGP